MYRLAKAADLGQTFHKEELLHHYPVVILEDELLKLQRTVSIR